MIVAKLAHHVDDFSLFPREVAVYLVDAAVLGQPAVDVAHSPQPYLGKLGNVANAVVEDTDDVVAINRSLENLIELIHRLLVADEDNVLLVPLSGTNIHHQFSQQHAFHDQNEPIEGNGVEKEGAGKVIGEGTGSQDEERNEEHHREASGCGA